MKFEDVTTIDSLTDLLLGGQAVALSAISDKDDCYQWIHSVLVRFRYLTRHRRDEGIVIRYLMEINGFALQQITRLIAQCSRNGRVRCRQGILSAW